MNENKRTMSNEDKLTETLSTVKSMSKLEKVFAALFSAGFIAIVSWVAVTNHVDAQQTEDIIMLKETTKAIRDTLPKLGIKQAVSNETIRNLEKSVIEIKSNQEKDRELIVRMLGKVDYLYDKEKARK